MHKKKLRLYPDNIAVRKLISPLESSVIPDRQRRANIHGALRSGFFLRCFGLFKKMNSTLIAVVPQKIRRFFEAETAQCTTSIHIPLSRRVLGLSAQFVCHTSIKLRITLKSVSGRAQSDLEAAGRSGRFYKTGLLHWGR
jgi:hypothetical protein